LPVFEAFGHRFRCPSPGGVSPPFRVNGLGCIDSRFMPKLYQYGLYYIIFSQRTLRTLR
jgi:hypothetical protein